jgi:sortase A
MLRRLVETSAWTLGLSLVLFYGVARAWSERARVEGIEAFRQASATSSATLRVAAADPTTPSASIDKSLWSEKRIAAYAESLSTPGVPEGLLRIPSLRLEVPIYAGDNELNLNRGAGHIEGTAELFGDGNVGIAGHRDGFFRVLKDITIDQDVFLDVAGRSLRYRVVDISVVARWDRRVLDSTAVPSITLVTCYPFYFVGSAPERFIVRAERYEDQATSVAAGGSET